MKQKSFTLIELLVVIVIIGILAGVIIVSVSSSINKANFAKAQSFSNTIQNELLGDLISEWTFNSPAIAGITEDSWGNNDGTLYGVNGLPQLQTKENCVYGTCLYFDGVDDYVNCGNKTDYNLANTDHTISFWIKANKNSATQYIFNRREAGTPGAGYLIYIDPSNYIRFEERVTISQTSLSSNFSSLFNSWHFVLASTDITSKIKKMYIDGNLVDQNVYTGDLINSNIPLYIVGSGTTSVLYTGSIDDVRLYSANLSSSQIKQQYVAGLDSLLSKKIISKEDYNEKINQLAQE